MKHAASIIAFVVLTFAATEAQVSGRASASYASRRYELTLREGPSVFADAEYFAGRERELRGWLGASASAVTKRIDRVDGLGDRALDKAATEVTSDDVTLRLWPKKSLPLEALAREVAALIHPGDGALVEIAPQPVSGDGWTLRPVWTIYADAAHEDFVRKQHLGLWDALVGEVRRALSGATLASGERDAIVVVGHGGMNAHLLVHGVDAALTARLGALVR